MRVTVNLFLADGRRLGSNTAVFNFTSATSKNVGGECALVTDDWTYGEGIAPMQVRWREGGRDCHACSPNCGVTATSCQLSEPELLVTPSKYHAQSTSYHRKLCV